MKQRSAQAIVLYAMDLEAVYGAFPIEEARDEFLRAEPWRGNFFEGLASALLRLLNA